MGDLIKNSRTVTFSGGNSLGLTQTTILYGKGQNITDIDYDKIDMAQDAGNVAVIVNDQNNINLVINKYKEVF